MNAPFDEMDADWPTQKVEELGVDGEPTVVTGPFGTSLGTKDFTEGGVSVLTIGCLTDQGFDLSKCQFVSYDKADELQRYRLRSGDFLFSRMATVGRAGIVGESLTGALYNYHIMRLRLDPAKINPMFFFYYVRGSSAVRDYLHEVNHGATRAGINSKELLGLSVPIPSMDIQLQVIAELESRLSRLDKAIADLRAAERKLTRHRSATLAAATSGKLVPTEAELAQHDGREYESGEQLLHRILTERRARWEADHLAALKVKGKTPTNDTWKAKYKEPVTPDLSGLPELPEGWYWTNLDHLLARIEAGKSFRCDERVPVDDEIGVLKVSAVSWGEYDEAEIKTCLDPSKVNAALFVEHGDFIFSRANTIDLVGACVLAKSVSRPAMLSDKTLRFVFAGEHLSAWVLYCLRSPHGRREIERLATGNQESMRNIGQGRIRAIRIPLPPAQDLRRVVDAIEGSMSATDNLATARDRALMRSTALRSTILQAAFTPDLAAVPA